MKILALNCGSSSVKFQLFDTSPEQIQERKDRVTARGGVERIGHPPSVVHFQAEGRPKRKLEAEIADHQEAIEECLACLTAPQDGPLQSIDEIDGVGHRIVHGGEHYSDSVLIDDEVIRVIEECGVLAPLHNPHNLRGVLAVRERLWRRPHVAVFDTAFHRTVPERAYTLGIPYNFYEENRLRRYGFHGTSHRYVCQRFAELKGGAAEDFKVITCHLGNGSSVCAVDRGRSVDSSMGFTPLDGLMMGTRPGALDPGVVLHMMSELAIPLEEMTRMLNKHSGLLGISGISSDIRALIREAGQGHRRAQLAIDVFCYVAKKNIGTFYAVLNGADAVVFTGGIGEHRALIRAKCCESLSALGIEIDPVRNEAAVGAEAMISADGSATEVWVVPTNEELLIARETVRCIRAC